MLYFRDIKGLSAQEYRHDMKFWCPTTKLSSYELTEDKKYAEWHKKVHGWMSRRFPNQEYRERYGYLHRGG